MNYLISAANSDIAISMVRILKQEKSDAHIIGLAPNGLYPALHYFDKVESIPYVLDKNYFHELLVCIKKYQINVFIPVSEAELSFFSNNIDLFSDQLGVIILINDFCILRNCLDKYETYKWLTDNSINVPETCLLKDQYYGNFPVIIKQRKGAGSKNIVIIKTKNLYLALKKEYEVYKLQHDFILQKYIGDSNNEFTCAIWRYNNVFRHLTLRRKLSGGTTSEAIVNDNRKINSLLSKIADLIKGDFFLNVQLRLEKGIPFIFEINPRFSSTIMMRHKFGFKDFIWSLEWLENRSISSYIPPVVNSQAFKVANELIFHSLLENHNDTHKNPGENLND